ncbi:hypothetical protein ACT7DB_00585 [Bacillus cereus]
MCEQQTQQEEVQTESSNDIVQVNLRPRRWMKDEIHEEAKHFNMSLHSYLIHICESREKPKMK